MNQFGGACLVERLDVDLDFEKQLKMIRRWNQMMETCRCNSGTCDQLLTKSFDVDLRQWREGWLQEYSIDNLNDAVSAHLIAFAGIGIGISPLLR
jgi:hypothetical protein